MTTMAKIPVTSTRLNEQIDAGLSSTSSRSYSLWRVGRKGGGQAFLNENSVPSSCRVWPVKFEASWDRSRVGDATSGSFYIPIPFVRDSCTVQWTFAQETHVTRGIFSNEAVTQGFSQNITEIPQEISDLK